MGELTVGLHIERGEGEPVVLLHSSGLSGRQWKRMTAELARRGLGAVVPDFSGHGASPAWPESEPFSIRVDVERVVKLLASLGPAHVIGHSYGGLVALLAAQAAPGSVRSLALFDPVAFGTLHPEEDRVALAEVMAAARSWGRSAEENEAWLSGFVDFWGGPGAWGALREEARAEFRRVGWVVSEGVRTLAEDKTPASAYAGFSFPVTLVTGGRSPAAAGSVVRRLAAAIPGARVVTVPDVGHLAPVTHANLVNPALLGALERAPHEEKDA